MEALIVLTAVLMVIVLLEVSYGIALCLMRWTPSLLLGISLGWLALGFGAHALQALAIGALATLGAKRVLLRVFSISRGAASECDAR